MQILAYLIFRALFSKNSSFHWRKLFFKKKVAIVEERLDGKDIDDIGNLEASPKLVINNEEYENLIVVIDGGERTRNINLKKKSDVFTIVYRFPLSNKCCRQVYFLNNHAEYSELVR